MTILIDFSHLSYRNVTVIEDVKRGEVNEDLITHMILNSIRAIKSKYSSEFGDIVICCDSRNYWRKDIFEHYKGKRKSERNASKIDWPTVFKIFDNIKNTLIEVFPYKVIEYARAEGDDVIAVIARDATEPTLIIGGDKDFIQLQKNPLVKQYSPNVKKFIELDKDTSPESQLFELIVRGDGADGIPNIKSDGDTFMIKEKRQKSISKINVAAWFKMGESKEFCVSALMLDNFERNKKLIDFDFIPDNIVSGIKSEYEKDPKGNKQLVMQYFIDNRMRILLQHLNEF